MKAISRRNIITASAATTLMRMMLRCINCDNEDVSLDVSVVKRPKSTIYVRL